MYRTRTRSPRCARLIEPEPAVMLAWQTAPTVDFTLVLTVRDMPEYQALVQRLFTQRTRTTYATFDGVSRRCHASVKFSKRR